MIFVKWSCSVKKFCTLENSQKGHFSKTIKKSNWIATKDKTKSKSKSSLPNKSQIEIWQVFETVFGAPPMKMHICNSFVTHRAFQAPGPLVKKLQKYSPTRKNASSGRKENVIRKPLFLGPWMWFWTNAMLYSALFLSCIYAWGAAHTFSSVILN